MWKRPAIAIVLLAVACSPASDEATTPTEAATTSTTRGTTTTLGDATTTTPKPSSTTTAPAPTTTEPSTTTKPTQTTTTTVPEGNEPPTIEIVSPGHLSAHAAHFDEDRNDNGADVALAAVVSDPNGDAVTVTWSSSTQGALGTGESIVVFLSTGGYDASQPIITATATDVWGAATSLSVQIIVWIPSDT